MDGGTARARGGRNRDGLISRRGVLRLGAAAVGGAPPAGLLSACGSGGGGGGGGGSLVFLSDQLSTTEETATMRGKVLSGFKDASVSFTSFSDTTQFIDQVIAQSKAGAATLDLIGGLQGDFVALARADPAARHERRHRRPQGQELPAGLPGPREDQGRLPVRALDHRVLPDGGEQEGAGRTCHRARTSTRSPTTSCSPGARR